MSRLPGLAPSDLSPEQRHLYDEILSGPRGKLGRPLTNDDGTLRGPFNCMLYSPGVGSPIQQTGAALRFATSLPADVRELAILVVAAEWRCEYEWHAHLPMAETAGHDGARLQVLWDGGTPDFQHAPYGLVLAAGRELFADRSISAATFEALDAALGPAQTFELLAAFGYYSLLAILMNSFDVRPG